MEFTAIIAGLQSAIMIEGGQGGATRIRFDAYDVDINKLMDLRGKKLSIEIKEITE